MSALCILIVNESRLETGSPGDYFVPDHELSAWFSLDGLSISGVFWGDGGVSRQMGRKCQNRGTFLTFDYTISVGTKTRESFLRCGARVIRIGSAKKSTLPLEVWLR
jgi:hypothetical protein